ncbi:ester cyclase [Candidatus Poribacteria bacterium]
MHIWITALFLVFIIVPQATAATDDVEANKALVRRPLEEAYNKGNLDVMDEIYAADYSWPVDNPVVHGAAEAKQHVAIVRAAFPDIHITAEDIIAEGDKAVVRWTIVATHKGEFMGIPPTGKQVTGTGIITSRIADGKIAGDWENSDQLGLMQQLGVYPPTPGGLPCMDREGEDFQWGDPSEVTGTPGDPEANKAVYRRLLEEVFIQGNMDAMDELISADLVNHDPLWPDVTDFESLKQWITMMADAASDDQEITIDDLIAEGDKVAGRWTTKFTDPTTGTHVKVTGVDIIRIADGKVVEWWWSKDYLGLLQKLGVIPTPGQKE